MAVGSERRVSRRALRALGLSPLGERGRGLWAPLIEAAQHGIPVIASDLPVYREVAGAWRDVFFRKRTPAHLAGVVRDWLKEPRRAGSGYLAYALADLA